MRAKEALKLKPGDTIWVKATVGYDTEEETRSDDEKVVWVDCQFPGYALNIRAKYVRRRK